MSIRTVIEINHDFIHRMREDPERFAEALFNGLAAGGPMGVNDHAQRCWNDLARHGVRHLGQRHHSTALKLKIGGRTYFEEPGDKF